MPTKKAASTKSKKKTTKAKTTRKTTTKKKTTAKKKASSKKSDLRAMVCAKDGECFWTTDGEVLKDLHDLQMAFGSMGDEVFLYHANAQKNDFADWVEHVLNDKDCADALRKSRKPSTARKVIVRHLRLYSL